MNTISLRAAEYIESGQPVTDVDGHWAIPLPSKYPFPTLSVRRDSHPFNGDEYRLLIIPSADVLKFNTIQEVCDYIEIHHAGELVLWDV